MEQAYILYPVVKLLVIHKLLQVFITHKKSCQKENKKLLYLGKIVVLWYHIYVKTAVYVTAAECTRVITLAATGY